MTKTETKSRAGEDVSPAQELSAAIAGFMSEFKDFSNGVNAKLQKQDDRMNKLDRKSMMNARPALAAAAAEEEAAAKAAAEAEQAALDAAEAEAPDPIAEAEAAEAEKKEGEE